MVKAGLLGEAMDCRAWQRWGFGRSQLL